MAGTIPPKYTETSINAGGYYYFPQDYVFDPYGEQIYGDIKSGSIRYSISQKTTEGRTTKVICQYLCQVMGFGDSITISGTPSIEFGSGYDTSEQQQNIINY